MKQVDDIKLWVGEMGWVKRDRAKRVVAVGLGAAVKGQLPVLFNFHRKTLVTVGNTSEIVPKVLCKPLIKELQQLKPAAHHLLGRIEYLAEELFQDQEPKYDRRGRYSKKEK
jgi:hypothetical protein